MNTQRKRSTHPTGGHRCSTPVPDRTARPRGWRPGWLALLPILFLLCCPARAYSQAPPAVPGETGDKAAQTSGQKDASTEEKKAPAAQPEAKDHQMQAVVVTATRTETPVADAPASVSVVTREDIENRNIQAVDNALNLLPGVVDKRSKGLDTTTRVTLRGIPEQKRTLVLLDGQPMNDGYTGAVNWNGIAPENVERIEVARGAFSSLYGPNAMGGVINILTRMPEKREVTMISGYGTDDFWTTYGSYGDKFAGKVSVFASYGYKASNGYPSDLVVRTPTTAGAGTVVSGGESTKDAQGNPAYLVGDRGDNTWWRDSGQLKFAFDLTDRSRATLSFTTSRYAYGYDDPHTFLRDANGKDVFVGPVLIDGDRVSLTEYNFLSGSGARTQNVYSGSYELGLFDESVLKVNMGVIDHLENWYTTPSSSATRDGGPGKLSETPSTAYYADAQLSFPAFGRVNFTVGAGFRYDQAASQEHTLTDWRNEHTATDLTYFSEGEDQIVSVFSQAEIKILDNLTGYLGLRGDWWRTYNGQVNQVGSAGFPQIFDDRDAFEASPKAALVYKPFDATTFRTSIGRSFRPPNVYELYRTWVYYSTTYASNPELDPETALSYDFGVEQGIGKHVTVGATYFHNRLYDLIYLQDVTSTLKQYNNAGGAETQGVELEARAKIGSWADLFAGYTYTDSEMLDNPGKRETEGKRLTGIPLNMYSIGGDFTYKIATLTLTGRYMDKVYNNDENLDKEEGVYGAYDSFFVADMNLRVRVTDYATVNFAIDNMFDEEYYSYYLAPGRTFFGGLTLKF